MVILVKDRRLPGFRGLCGLGSLSSKRKGGRNEKDEAETGVKKEGRSGRDISIIFVHL